MKNLADCNGTRPQGRVRIETRRMASTRRHQLHSPSRAGED